MTRVEKKLKQAFLHLWNSASSCVLKHVAQVLK